MAAESANYLAELHQLLNQHFNLAEIRTLCLRLNVDYESLAGEEKPSQNRELLLGLARNGRLPELITSLQQERPNVDWPPVPDDFELPKLLVSAEAALAGDTQIGQIGDIFNVGDITGSYTAIGSGAQVIVNQIEQVLSAAEEIEKETQVAEKRLARAIQTKIENYTRLPTTVGLEAYRNPYRSLLNYRIEDAPYFYGRQEAIKAMLVRLDRNRLTVLQSASGSGKTSLLQAGLAARLLAARHLPLYVRPYNEPPHMAIKRAFLPDYKTLDELKRFRDEKMSLLGFLRRVTSYLGPRKLFIFLDQFEEFFNDLTPEKEAFALELQQCINDPQLDVGWVLSLREEYFAKLRLFEAIRPYENWYFLETFRHKEAHEVITQPALKMGVTYEKKLVDCIIKDVSHDGETLVPVHVQLVCTALFNERHEQSDATIISTELYNRERGEGESKSPGAKGILRSHLSRTIQQQMSGPERKLAWQVLRTLVTSQKHRTQRNRREILNELQAVGDTAAVNELSFDNVLKTLETNRLIRTDEDDEGGLSYELAHDYLLDEIEVDPQFQAIKLAQEILAQELPFYLDRGVLLAEDKYDIVNSQREFLHLDEASLELLEKSRKHFEMIQEQEVRRAQEETRQKEKLLLEEKRANRSNRIIIGILVLIVLGFLYITVIQSQILRYAAAELDDYSQLVSVPMPNGEAFQIEAYEVTNERYKRCVDAGECNRPNGFQTIEDDWVNSRMLPVVSVDANDALTFCNWIGRTLPTAEQFEVVTLPVSQWPMMNEDQAVFCRNRYCPLQPQPVAMRQISQNPNGLPIYDLVGNVSEWSRTKINNNDQCEDVTEFSTVNTITQKPDAVIVFGNNYSTPLNEVGDYALSRGIMGKTNLFNRNEADTGFRCVSVDENVLEKQYTCPSLND